MLALCLVACKPATNENEIQLQSVGQSVIICMCFYQSIKINCITNNNTNKTKQIKSKENKRKQNKNANFNSVPVFQFTH